MALACEALRHQPGGGVVIVVGHLQAVLVVAGAGDLLAPTGRGAVLRLDNDIAPRGEIFRPARGIPTPLVTRPRTAVRRDDRRIGPRAPDGRIGLGQVGRQHQAVARRILHKRHIAEVVGHDLRTRLAEQGQSLAFDIGVIFRRGLRTLLLDDQRLAILAVGVDAHRHIGRHRDLHLFGRGRVGPDQGRVDFAQGLFQAVAQRGHLVVVPIDVAFHHAVEGEAQDFSEIGLAGGADDTRDVEGGVGEDRLAELALADRIFVDRRLVLAVVQLDDGDIGILGEAENLRLLVVLDEVAHVLFPGIAVRVAEIDGDIGVTVLIIDSHTGTHRRMVQVPDLVAILVGPAFDLVIAQVQPVAVQVDLVHRTVGAIHGQDVVGIVGQRTDETQTAGAAHVVFDFVADPGLVLVGTGRQAERLEERAFDIGDHLAISVGTGAVDVDLLHQCQHEAVVLHETRRLDVEAGRRRDNAGRGAGVFQVEDRHDPRLAIRRYDGRDVLAVRRQADPIDTVTYPEIFGLGRRGRNCGRP